MSVQIESDLKEILTRFEQRFDKLDQKLDKLNDNATDINLRLTKVETKLDAATEDIKEIKSTQNALSSDSDLTKANLGGANLSYANLGGANLSYANLSNKKIKSACFWEKAIYTDVIYIDALRKWIVVDQLANQKRIQEIKQDKSSDLEILPNCNRWK